MDFVGEGSSIPSRFLSRITKSQLEKLQKHLGKDFSNQKAWPSAVPEGFMDVG